MREGKKLFNRIASFILAIVMVVSVFAITPPQEVEAATKALSFKAKGKTTVTISDKNCWYVTKKVNYIKFVPGVTGYITLNIKNNSSIQGGAYGSLTFCNSKKQPIGRKDEYFDSGVSSSQSYQRIKTYGVTKGKTYYFKVKSYGGIKVTAEVKSVKKGSNTSKTKAKTLSKNKDVTGVILANDKKVDWYKIKLTKKQKINLTYKVKTNGARLSGSSIYYDNGIKITLCKSNGKAIGGSTLASLKYPSDTITYYTKVTNTFTGQSWQEGLNKGTYYVRVERYNASSSGSYTIKWK
ncbi:MAG: hypothetical protein K1V96_03680 [Lachnospiraceae bacterium]